MKTRMLVIGMLGLALAGWQLPGAWAAEEEHEHKEGAEKVPDTVGGIWAEVQEHQEQLEKIIADKKLDDVHEVAFEIRDMVNALPEKSKDLSADDQAKLKANAKYVADLATRLDESGDAKDQASTEANFHKLQGILKTIESLYPPESLKASSTESSEDKPAVEQVYTCQMHPEVTSDKPGNCPKCGMALTLRAEAPSEHQM